MKFFYKMFIGMTVILAAALGVVEYATVSYTLEHAISREQDAALLQHQMAKYSIETVILNLNDDNPKDKLADMMEKSGKTMVGDDGGIYLVDKETSTIYINSCNCEVENAITDNEKAGSIQCRIVVSDKISEAKNDLAGRYIHVISSFTMDDSEYTLLTEKNITSVFVESAELQHRCTIYYLVILLVGMLIILILSLTITKPLSKLSKATGRFASGDYSVRSNVKTRDEVGELSEAFNDMATTIENKIEELKMAAKRQEDFTANFAHELKTPMTSIIGYADTIYQKKLSPEEIHKAAEVILNEGMRLEALSFKMLELITMDKTEFDLEETQIKEVILDCVNTVKTSAQKHDVKLICHADEAWAWLEYDLFKTMLLNLIDNAIKSGCDSVEISGNIWHSDKLYRITVKDNGRGIPSDELDRITEAFYMVDKSRSRSEHGAGLGLALVAKIAALHDIKINFESVQNEGTKVYFDMKMEEQDET